MRPSRLAPLVAALAAGLLLAPAATPSPGTSSFTSVVDRILAEPYQPDYVPLGFDSAFTESAVLNAHPTEDYTSGSRQGSPDAPPWPSAFEPVLLTSADGAPLPGRVARQPGKHPGVVVVHGFNSNASDSVVRWAALLYASGYNVAAVDLRGFPPAYRAGYRSHVQTFGWKEAEDVVAIGRYLQSQPGVTSVGVVGFSLGGETTVLALARDAGKIFKAGLNFSGPADQNTQIYSTAEPPGCQTPFCTFPATSALMALVIPPNTHTDPCTYLGTAAASYGTTPYELLAQTDPFQKQLRVRVPLLNVYAADDPLVAAFQARMMAAYNDGNRYQRTIELERGLHAYFNDRWWQQRAILLYFKSLLPGAASDITIETGATVNQTPGGSPAGSQLVDLGSPTRAEADALAAPYICDTSQRSPALSSTP